MREEFTIKKKVAIEAVLTEPLKKGEWFHSEYFKVCEVCAVGAVLRNTLNSERLTTLYDEGGGIDALCKHKFNSSDAKRYLFGYIGNYNETNYLGNLSMLFEHLMSISKKGIGPEVRLELVNLIEATWPDEFTIVHRY
jgi:hypothetical protein